MSKGRLPAVAVLTLVFCCALNVAAYGQLTGVQIDANGVLRLIVYNDPGGRLMQGRVAAARRNLDQDIVRRSQMRKISLNRLEKAVADGLANNRQPTDAMKNLAGLTRVKYVFFYPETNDIVLAGPAEGWCKDLAGRAVGIHSGRPVVELQDLIVALRAFAPGSPNDPFMGVSINPRKEGLRRMQEYLNGLRNIRKTDAPRIAQSLRETMGMQDVAVHGISPRTHFAQVLVEADYRMKMIGIGLEMPPVKMTTYIAKAGRTSASKLQRWYFVPEYECVRVTEDDLAMEMVGDGVKLLTEDQLVSADGSRRSSGQTDRASNAFAESFTRTYSKMAKANPLWAQMRNCIDLVVAVAFIREQGYLDRSGWDLGIFRDEQAYAVETYEAPAQVETVANVVWKGNLLMTPVGGGVQLKPTLALEPRNLLDDEKQRVKKAHDGVDPAKIADRWWWD
ncbi:MAG: DUF1598 domain-containing protein [Pirellulales bacterium]